MPPTIRTITSARAMRRRRPPRLRGIGFLEFWAATVAMLPGKDSSWTRAQPGLSGSPTTDLSVALYDHDVVAARAAARVHPVDGEVLRNGADRLCAGRTQIPEHLGRDVDPAHRHLRDHRAQVRRRGVEDRGPGDRRAAEVRVVVEAGRGRRRAPALLRYPLGAGLGEALLDLRVAQGFAHDRPGVGAARIRRGEIGRAHV